MAIIVPILSTFDAAGVNKAQRAFKGLSGTAKVSAVAFGTLGIAISKFGYDAVKAAAEDQKAQLKLAKTLQNVTGATNAQIAASEKFITTLQFSTGVSDTQLRPALETLVRATGDVTKAQGLLKLGLDVSAGSGRDLESISLALAKAQGGQFTALQRLGIVIPENIKKSKDFAKVQEYLNTLFGGQAAVAAGTFEGKMAILGQRTSELKESIGGALLPALTSLVDYIIANIMPALEGFINGLSGKESVASSFDKSAEAGYSWGQNVRAFIQTVVSYQKPLLVFAGVLAGIWAVSKTVAAVGAIVKVIQALITVYKTLQTTAVLAATAMAFASGGTSVAVGLIGAAAAAAGIAAAFVGVNKVIDTYTTKVTDLPKITYAPDGITGGTQRTDVSLAPIPQATTDGGSNKTKDASKAAAAASKAAAAAAKKAAEEMAKVVAAASKLATAALTKMNDKLTKAREKLQAAKDAYKEFKNGIQESITGLLNFGDAASAETGSFLENLRKQVTGAVGFADKVKQLIAMGLSETGIQQVLAAGADAGTKIADELIAGGASAISETNALIQSVTSAAQILASTGADKFYQAGITQGAAMVDGIIASVKKAGFIISGGAIALPKDLQAALNEGKLTTAQVKQLNTLLSGVPKLADGGIVNKPTLAMIGERGPEAVIPLSGRNSTSGSTINLTVNAGMGANGTIIGREIVDAIRKYERSNGPIFMSA
jgi:hypothetical protein